MGVISNCQKTKTKELQDILVEHNLPPEQVYNCDDDEIGLYWKMLPSKTLAARTERSAPGYKLSKEGLTILACANASGTHKLLLTVIGKAMNPHMLKNSNTNALPIIYQPQGKAWMDSALFCEWLLKILYKMYGLI